MKQYWYLREGDFLPEEIETLCKNWHRCCRHIVEFLSESGNIFESKEEAMQASMKVREVIIIHQVRQGRIAKIHTDVDIPQYDEG